MNVSSQKSKPNSSMTGPTGQAGRRIRREGKLALAALGIVFGDLGTSPLYALQEGFHGAHGVAPTPENVIGLVSLFLWSLVVMVSIKYVLILMQADNRGEGGILALLALLTGERVHGKANRRWIYLAMVGTAMLYGDGVITPAISVLSAVEGLSVATPAFDPYIVPLTVVILVILFAIQSLGSSRVGMAFGPQLATWFIVIGVLGVASLIRTPAILAAVNPAYAVQFFLNNGVHGFVALGAVALCLTGGEALYAAQGHFGRRAIRLAWYGLVLPALVANYLGQGALLLRDPAAVSRPFYSLVPSWALYPVVLLAARATAIAAQALISAVFSLTWQAMQLGLVPRMQAVHTSERAIGQIYLPMVNWLLMASTIGVVLLFRSSSRLAAAFGLAVSTTMLITGILFAVLLRRRKRWARWPMACAIGVFLLADSAFVAANSLKFADGGWLPVAIGIVALTVTASWFIGQSALRRARDDVGLPLDVFVSSLAMSPPHRVPGVAVFMAPDTDSVPLVLLHHLKHNQMLHETVVVLSLIPDEVPRVPESQRLDIKRLDIGFVRIKARYGYKEKVDVPHLLEQASTQLEQALYDSMATTFYLGREALVAASGGNPLRQGLERLFILMHKNEVDATTHFGLPPNRVVELGARLELPNSTGDV